MDTKKIRREWSGSNPGCLRNTWVVTPWHVRLPGSALFLTVNIENALFFFFFFSSLSFPYSHEILMSYRRVSTKVSTKPWREDGGSGPGPRPIESVLKIPKVEHIDANPLIPQSVLEIGQQRTIVLTVFMAIQAYKFYQLLWPAKKFSAEAFAIKYMFVDAVFLWMVPIFRIPWLTFGSSATVLQIVGMAVFNIVLSSSIVSVPGVVLSLYKTLFEGEVSLSGSKIRSSDLYDASSHFSGKYTVYILPESTAFINPFETTFCIEDNTSVSIPIKFNATDPNFLQLRYVDFETLDESKLNFTKKELKNFKLDVPQGPSTTKISFVSIPVHKPGLYRLERVRDSNNLDVRLQGGDVLVSNCPTSYLVPGRHEPGNVDIEDIQNRCIGEVDSPKLVVHGVPPLKVKYSRSIKGKDSLFSFQSVQPDHFISPLIGGLDFNYRWEYQESLAWATAQRIELEISTTLNSAGQWKYTIEEVEDAFGNHITYSRAYKGSPAIMTAKNLTYKFAVHSRPQVRFGGCDPENPIKLALGKSAELPVDLISDPSGAPYTAAIERFPEEYSTEGDGELTMHALSHLGGRLSVNEPGVYRLKNITGKYCAGDVIESSTCLVYVPPQPTINIDFVDVDDRCAGSIGMQADITLTGSPPFTLGYQVMKDGEVVIQDSINIEQSRHLFEFRPKEAGLYTYEFTNLTDSMYKNVALEGKWRFEQTLRVLAKASFENSYTYQRGCSGDALGLDVEFQGNAPFKLTYEMIQPNSKTVQYTKDAIEGATTQIVTPPLKAGGRYTLSLKSVEDANGCKTPLEVPDATIDIRRQRPWAAFLPVDGSMHVRALENQAVGLPLRLSGEGPWDINYRYTDVNGAYEDITTTVMKANGEKIFANKKGNYSLIEVNDSYCPGEIADGKDFEISWFDRPALSVAPSSSLSLDPEKSFTRKDVCEGDEDVFEVALSGVAPFSLTYDISGPITSNNKNLQVPTKFANIKMETSEPGLYEYVFKDIQDELYNSKTWSGEKMKPIIVRQIVNAKPSAGFVNKGRIYKTCLNTGPVDRGNEEGIPVQFKGEPPFALTVHIKHESSGTTSRVTVQNIDENHYSLKSLFKELGLGRHAVSLAKVVDGTGCSRDMFSDDEVVYIQVADIPRLSPISDKRDYCVGDRIGFNLAGIAPFEVVYNFNDKKQRASADSIFSRVASLPGTLQLVSLNDMSACGVNLEEEAPITIHPLPSVSIISSERSVQHINEGDQAELIFTFSGTPPFSFTYARSELVGKPAREKVVETHSVSKIDGHQYSIYTSMQGTYEVISVEDAYCSARVS